MTELDQVTKAKFDRVLTGVVEPQSELSIGELGLVSKFGYYPADRTIQVHLDVCSLDYQCPACYAVDDFIIGTLERRIRAALLEEFPDWTIEFVSGKS